MNTRRIRLRRRRGIEQSDRVVRFVSYAIFHPTEGERSIAAALQLERYGGWRVSHGGVRNVLRRAGIGRRLARLAAAEALSAAEGGPLTERTLREIRAIERPTVMHIGSDTVGAELFADTMYVGKLKGVGTIWQYTLVDGACSFGFGRAQGGRKSAKAMARFLERDVVPVYRRAGIRLVRINTDGGPEFGTRRSPRSASSSASSTIACRRARPTSTPSSSASRGPACTCTTAPRSATATTPVLPSHYNFERPHRGYRTAGRTPASIFYAHRPSLLEMKGWDSNELLKAHAV